MDQDGQAVYLEESGIQEVRCLICVFFFAGSDECHQSK